MAVSEKEFGKLQQRMETFEEQYDRLFKWIKEIEIKTTEIDKMQTEINAEIKTKLDMIQKGVEKNGKNGNGDMMKSLRFWLLIGGMFIGGGASGSAITEAVKEEPKKIDVEKAIKSLEKILKEK